VITYYINLNNNMGFNMPSLKLWSMFNWWINQ